MSQKACRVCSFLGLCLAFSPATSAWASINVSLSGSVENTSNALEKSRDNSISANLSTSLGEHVLIGITHRRSFENKTGYKRAQADDNTYLYIPFKDNGQSTTNSLDLTIIPFNSVVSPFVFGGIARRDYESTMVYLGSTYHSKQSLFPIPNYGFGLMVQLGGGFQLKITQTFTPATQIALEEGVEVAKVVNDSYTQVGIGYRL